MIETDLDVPGIAIVRSSRPWARTLHRYVVDHGGAIVRTRPLEERQAIEEEYDILIVDDVSSFLSAHIVDELHRRGRKVLGVYDPEEFSASAEQNTGKARLLRLGADGVIASQAGPEDFVKIIETLAPKPGERRNHLDLTESGTTLSNEDFSLGVSAEVRSGSTTVRTSASGPRGRRGHITAVIGASGGSGATEIAIELGRSLGRRGERTIVVDGDDLAPALAQRLNLSLHPNLRTAVDVVEHGTGRLAECLTAIANGLEILVGIPHPKDWVEMRGTDMTALLSELSRGRPQIVVNASPEIEDLTQYGGADRFAMSRAAVAAADTIVIVCPPTPVGVARLIDSIADFAAITEGKAIQVVVNRARKGNYKRREIAREIARSLPSATVHFVPEDHKVEEAGWEGTLVPSGDFTKAIGSTLAPTIPRTVAASGRGRTARPTAKKA